MLHFYYVGTDGGRMSAAGNNERVNSFMHAMQSRGGGPFKKMPRKGQNKGFKAHDKGFKAHVNHSGLHVTLPEAYVNHSGRHVTLPGRRGGKRNRPVRVRSKFDDQQHGLEYPISYGMRDASSGHIF